MQDARDGLGRPLPTQPAKNRLTCGPQPTPRRRWLVLAAATLLAAGPAQALADDKPPTPTHLPGGQVITIAQARALLSAKQAQFVDTRSLLNFGKGHIPGALVLSYKELSGFTEQFDASLDSFQHERLPAAKTTPLVFYSHGPTGWKAYKASVLAIRLGYSQVHYLRGGWDEWSAARLAAAP